MHNNHIEQEIKLQIENLDKLVEKLISLGAEKIATDFQRTVRFDTENDDLEKRGTFLRVRSGHGNKITMKRELEKKNDNVFEREEIETSVEDIEKMRQIIKNLGFTKERIMEKYRSNWKYKTADISIDELPFGLYLEIEATPEIIDEIVADLEIANSKRIVNSYWGLLDENNKKYSKNDENIVFNKEYKSLLN